MSYQDDINANRVYLEEQKNRIFIETVSTISDLLPNIMTIVNSEEQLRTQIKEIKEVVDEQYGVLFEEAEDQIKVLAAYESDFQKAIITNSIAYGSKNIVEKVGRELLYTSIFKTPVEGLPFYQNSKKLTESAKNSIERAVRIGTVNGESIAQIRGRVRQAVNLTNNRYNSFIRTSIQAAANTADQLTFEKNSKLIKKIQYVAILDSRTTDICKSLNRQVFNINEGPRPPQHWNCRSFTIPIFVEEDILDESYADFVKKENNKDFAITEDGRFKPTNKQITVEKQKSIMEDRLGVKI